MSNMKKHIKGIIVIVAQCVFVLGSAEGQGDPNLIKNGGFETGSLMDWTTGTIPAGGIVEVDTTYDTLGPVVNPNPTDGGRYFAVMSPDGEHDSVLSQDPAIPAGFSQPVTLSFEYDLIAKALAANESAADQDATLKVTIGGDSVFSETFAEAGGPSLSTLDASGQTGWQTESIPLTTTEFNDIRSDGLDLKFSVDEVAGGLALPLGSGFDLAAAIDNVELNYTSAPDSTSTALLLGGVLSAICFVKRKTA
jgi:hypothetical protein